MDQQHLRACALELEQLLARHAPAVTEAAALRSALGPLPEAPVLLDAGCGQGKSFRYLQQVFAPERLIGLDADPHSLDLSRAEAAEMRILPCA